MAWSASNALTAADTWTHTRANALANDDRTWGGNVDAGGYNLSNLGVLTFSSSRGIVNAAGDLGLGTITPVAGPAGYPAQRTLQMGDRLVVQNVVGSQAMFANNAHYDGAWKYVVTAAASAIRFGATGTPGDVTVHIAASGSAGATISNWDTTDVKLLISAARGRVNIPAGTAYADNAAAVAGSLQAGDVYWTATGELRRVV